MREIPEPLARLRARVGESQGLYHRGLRLTQAEWLTLTPDLRQQCEWRSADPKLVAKLIAFERAFTESFEI